MAPVLVLGEALMDRLSSGPVAGGAPFNVARSLAALGLPVRLISRIGAQDEGGDLVLQSAARCGLDTSGIQRDAAHATGAVTVHSAQGNHWFDIHENAAWDYLDATQALAAIPSQTPSFVYFGTLSQRSGDSRQAVRAVLEHTTALRYLDLNLRPPFTPRELVTESLLRADWLKVNDDELATVFAWFMPEVPADTFVDVLGNPHALQPAVAALLAQFSIKRLVLTLGASGWATFDATGTCDAQGPAHTVATLVDTVGAGDAFSAMLLAGISSGLALQQCLPLAARYAAAMCEQRGPMAESISYFELWRHRLRQAQQEAPWAPANLL